MRSCFCGCSWDVNGISKEYYCGRLWIYIYIYIMGYTRIYNFHLSMVGKPSIYGDIGGTDLLIFFCRLGICHQTKWDISRSYKNLSRSHGSEYIMSIYIWFFLKKKLCVILTSAKALVIGGVGLPGLRRHENMVR